MLKSVFQFFSVILIVLSFAACTDEAGIKADIISGTKFNINETSSELACDNSSVTDFERTSLHHTKTSTKVHTTDKTDKTKLTEAKPKLLEIKYFRSLLSSKEKQLYDDWLNKILEYENIYVDFSTSAFTYEEMHNVTDALREDYPEFWLYMYESYEYTDEDEAGNYDAISGRIYPSYNWIWEDTTFKSEYMNNILNKIDDVCDEIISRMPDGTYAEKYEFLAREIAGMTVYYDNEDSQSKDWAYCHMNGPLLYGRGLCQAYAQAYQYLCNRAGLWCICTSGDCHEWNMVMLEDGSTYHVDVTWADSEYYGFDESYFLLTEEEIEADHIHEDKEYIVASGKSLK